MKNGQKNGQSNGHRHGKVRVAMVGVGNSIHAGLVTVADASAEMDERGQLVLTNDRGIAVERYDALSAPPTDTACLYLRRA